MYKSILVCEMHVQYNIEIIITLNKKYVCYMFVQYGKYKSIKK
jgi:hypothetical protein